MVGRPMAEVPHRGQKPVDEDQPMPRASPDDPLPRPGHQPRLAPFAPQRTQLDDQSKRSRRLTSL